MEMSFKQVEQVFVERFAIDEKRAVGFRARLQHLQRRAMPSGVKTGKGKRASYGWMQVIQLMVVLDFLDLGMTPDIAVRRVQQSTDQIIAGIHRVVSRFETKRKLVNAIDAGSCSFDKAEYIVTSAAVLSFAGVAGQEFLTVVDGRSFFRSLTDDPAIEPMSAFVNIGTRMMLVANLVGARMGLTPAETADDLKNWLDRWANEDTLS